MGSSAISGELIKNIFAKQFKKPVIINRNWNLPNFVNEKSLVFIISYSGKTQETLSCLKQAIEKKSKIIVITQGGEIKKIALRNKLPLFKFKYPAPPRAGLKYCQKFCLFHI